MFITCGADVVGVFMLLVGYFNLVYLFCCFACCFRLGLLFCFGFGVFWFCLFGFELLVCRLIVLIFVVIGNLDVGLCLVVFICFGIL